MRVEELQPFLGDRWDAYVDAHPAATCYHLRAWQTVAERAYGLCAPFLLARDPAGAVRGVLPLFVVNRTPFSGYLTTGLFGAYGSVLADDERAARALLARARRIAEEWRARYLVVKALGDEPLDGFDKLDQWVIATLPLQRDPQVLWRGFRDKIRNAVRKAQRSGFTVCSGASQLPGFYDVLAENMHRKGAPIYGRAVMVELLRSLGERAEVITLRRESEVVSGALLIRYKGVVCVPFASSRPSSFHLNPNNLLYWEIISRSCESGMGMLDFGRSLRGSGPLEFKLGWGATQMAQPFHLQTLRGRPPRFDVESRGLKRLVRLWQRLPRFAADALGPSICRRFLV